MEETKTTTGTAKRKVLHRKGVTYFDKDTERKIFFILTLIMLILGILVKLGVFSA